MFANDTSHLSKVVDTFNSQNALNSDLESVSNWAYEWKLQFNPDAKKQANEAIFCRKSNTYMSFFVNQIHIFIHQSKSITILLLNVLIRSTWVSSLTPNLTLTFILNRK